MRRMFYMLRTDAEMQVIGMIIAILGILAMLFLYYDGWFGLAIFIISFSLGVLCQAVIFWLQQI